MKWIANDSSYRETVLKVNKNRILAANKAGSVFNSSSEQSKAGL